jgi:mono/diheme cytochrome c family protein
MGRASVLIAVLALSFSIAAEVRSVLDGVYTSEQATRGLKVYAAECARCHADNLLGGESTPELVGDSFLERWTGKTVGDLYAVTRGTMPTDGPASLSRRQYADVAAYMLSVNKFPAGQKELEGDAALLKEIRIETKR